MIVRLALCKGGRQQDVCSMQGANKPCVGFTIQTVSAYGWMCSLQQTSKVEKVRNYLNTNVWFGRSIQVHLGLWGRAGFV